MRIRSTFVLLVFFVTVSVFVSSAAAQSLHSRMLAAEDARVSTDVAPPALLEGLRAQDPTIVAEAIRGLGRFERPAFVRLLTPFLTNLRPQVRREAANALAQSVASASRAADGPPLPPEVAEVTRVLTARLRVETDPYALGAAAESLGRLPQRSLIVVRESEVALRALLPPDAGAAGGAGTPLAQTRHPAPITGAVKGLDAIARFYQRNQPLEPATLQRLRVAATLGSDPSDGDFAFIRRIAWQTLGTVGGADAALVQRGLDDPDAQVRRLAVLALVEGQVTDEERGTALAKALNDPSFNVRYDAVRTYGRLLLARDCAPVIAASRDANPHVALLAIDTMGGCPGAVAELARLADGTEGTWHARAHAMVSLAKVSREQANVRLGRFGDDPRWEVRLYAARAAAELGAAARLERLAADANDNVRTEALLGLVRVRRHDADAIYIDALSRRDYQVVLTAAKALEGSPNGTQAVPALVQAFTRLTLERRETSRDARLAVLTRLRELGSRAQAGLLQPCLADFDPVVANACAAMLRTWTGVTAVARPMPLPPQPVVEPLPARARLTLAGGKTVMLRLLTDEAPASVNRFAALAAKGYYNGLTFHRVVPNFVLQGGSPGANEYAGDGPFMRDELGLRSHTRGTLGVSTRGRDTGDAQFFVNLVDNPRLDHEFTVFADVTSGMDALDEVLEGDVIERVDVSR